MSMRMLSARSHKICVLCFAQSVSLISHVGLNHAVEACLIIVAIRAFGTVSIATPDL